MPRSCSYQLGLLGDYDKAIAAYQEASRLDEGSVEALQGTTYCQIMQGDLEAAEQQLEFMAVIQQSVGRTAALAFLDAMLAWRRHKNSAKQVTFLDEALTLHFEELEEKEATGQLDTFQWFVAFNAHFLLSIVREHLAVSASPQPGAGEEGAPQPTNRPLTPSCPLLCASTVAWSLPMLRRRTRRTWSRPASSWAALCRACLACVRRSCCLRAACSSPTTLRPPAEPSTRCRVPERVCCAHGCV